MHDLLFPAVAPAAVWLAMRLFARRAPAPVPAVHPDRDDRRRHRIARLADRVQAKCVPAIQAGR